MLEAIKYYNNQYQYNNSSIKTTPLKAENGSTPKEEVYNNLIKIQEKRLAKHNIGREKYEENRKEGYIKNYKSLRHKDEPKYRK